MKGVNTCASRKCVHVQQKAGFIFNNIKKKKKKES